MRAKKKISSDRLIRVRDKSSKKSNFFEEPAITNSEVRVSELIKVGDWCFFKYVESNSNEMTSEMICLGSVLAFKFNDGKTAKEKKYNGDFVNLKENPLQVNKLDVLSSWYFVNDQAQLVPTKIENHHFIQLKNFIATVIMPITDPDTNMLFFLPTDFEKINIIIASLVNLSHP